MADSVDSGTVQGGAFEPEVAGSQESASSPKAEQQDTGSQPQGGQQSPPEAKEKGPGPWDAELQRRGLTDPRVDQFIREVVQPHVTQLEQQLAQSGGSEIDQVFEGDYERAAAAAMLVDALQQDPVQAYIELGEVLGIDLDGLGGQGAELEGGEFDDEGLDDLDMEEGEEPEDPRLKWIEQQIKAEEEAKADAEYEQHLQALSERIEGFDPKLYSYLVVAHEGDPKKAFEAYMQFHKPPAPQSEAPPALHGGGTPPAPAPQYQSIDDAISAFLAESKASRP